jgi:hypothetical protein
MIIDIPSKFITKIPGIILDQMRVMEGGDPETFVAALPWHIIMNQ